MALPEFLKREKNNTNDTEKEKMTEQQAYDLIREWGDELEVRLKDEDFETLQKELWQAVISERLAFDRESETFVYVLKKPIEKKDGSGFISMIKIEETDMNGKREITKHKNDIDTLAALFKAYCKDSEGKQIELGFLTRIKDRDQAIISAVILGFFVQVVPGSK